MTGLGAWLRERRPGMPTPLRGAVERVVRGASVSGERPIPDQLAGAALDRLAGLAHEPSERARAPELLAVDALLTYALEAAAEDGPESLDRLLETLTFDRFGEILDRESP